MQQCSAEISSIISNHRLPTDREEYRGLSALLRTRMREAHLGHVIARTYTGYPKAYGGQSFYLRPTGAPFYIMNNPENMLIFPSKTGKYVIVLLVK